MTNTLSINNVSVGYYQTNVVKSFGFDLQRGEIGCLLGPSGCGKTTLLRAIAGFEPINSGEIYLNDHLISSVDQNTAPEKRNIGMVFQDFALFPHLTITDNITFGIRKSGTHYKQQRCRELLSLVGLEGFESRYPHELSGGQQQRVALARALAPNPALLLMDEPFSSLDVELRTQMVKDVREVLKQTNTTAILVTHDQHEAFLLADHIGVMNEGKLQQWDSGYNLYHKPANLFVADFIGMGVFLDGVVLNDHKVETEMGILDGDLNDHMESGSSVKVLVRPDDIIHDDDSHLKAEVIDKAFRGADYLYTLIMPSGTQVLCLAPSHHNHHIGERIGIHVEIDHLVIFNH